MITILIAIGLFFAYEIVSLKPAPKTTRNQFYDTCYASWQAPRYQVEEITAVITGYSSTFRQTDSTPFITASNKRVEQGIIACPRNIPFGSIIKIEGKDYVCEDRLSQKYPERYDIWFPTEKDAREFGRQEHKIIIYKAY